MKYLLTTGESTTKVEYYIIDLFKLYLQVYPNDIPGASDIGFDFILTDTKKDELAQEVKSRIGSLVTKIKNKFSGSYTITTDSIDVIDETTVKLVITVNSVTSDDIIVTI